jgi:peroxiredoxin
MFAARDAALLGLAMAACAAPASLNVGDVVPDFVLTDVNSASPTAGVALGPTSYEGQVAVWYFGHSNCGYCSAQFGELDRIAADLAAAGYDVPVVGVNAAGLEASNGAITEGRTLPWLQDTEDVDAWGSWGAVWRDAYVLDGDLRVLDKRNLTAFDLTNDDNAAAYAALLSELASSAPAATAKAAR